MRYVPVGDTQRRLLERAAHDLVRDGRHRRRAEARAARAAADAETLASTATGAPDRTMDAALSTVRGQTGRPLYGVLLKDYRPVAW